MGVRRGTRTPVPSSPRSWGTNLRPFLAIAGAATIVYANTFQNEFLFDDLETIVEQKSRGDRGWLAGLVALLKGKPAYRPIRSASYAFDYAFSGLDPWGYHLSNLVYHILSAILLFLIARMLFDRARPALFAALLFALHPIQTDAVTYLSGRRDVLSGLFVLAGFCAFLYYRRTRRTVYLALALFAYPLAFFSKESGIILPLLCFLYDLISHIRVGLRGKGASVLLDVWTSVRAAFRQGRLLYFPLAVLAGGMTYYVLFLVRGTWQRTYHGGSLWFTLLTMARVVLHYITLLMVPLTLNADYSFDAFPVTTSWSDPAAVLAVVTLAALSCGLLACLRTRPLAAFGGLWFFAALLPVSQIVPHHEMMAEHYLYVPSAGFFLLIAALLEPLLARPRFAPALSTAAVAALVILSLRTVWRNADWRNDLTLWSKTVATAPRSARARNNLAGAYLRRGQPSAAREQLEAALEIKPDFPFARANLGKLYLDQGDLEQAERELVTALQLKPNELVPRLWLGAVYARTGRLAEAESQFRPGLSRPPYDAYAYNNLGTIWAKAGRVAEAESAFLEALRRRPDFVEAKENLARLHRLRESSAPAVEPPKGAVP